MTNNSNNHSCKKGRCYNTQIPGCRRIHCKLHDRVEWYCRWQHNKYRSHVHWGVVVLLLVLIVLQIYTIVSLNIPRAYAAISLSQTKFSSNNFNDTSISVIFDNIPAKNNLLIAIAGNRDSSTPSTPSGWFVAIDQSANSPGQVIFYKIAGTSEPTKVTVSGYSTPTRLGLHIYEYSGIDTTSPLDQTSSDNKVATIPDGETVSSGSVTTLQNNELLIAGFVINDGSSNTNFSGFSNSFTERNDFRNSGQPASRSTYAGADRIVSAIGTYFTSATASNSGDWRGQIATFKAAVVNSPPILGYTSDNVLGTATQETDGSGKISILFKVKDADAPDTSTFVLGSAQYRVGVGAWNAVTDGSISFSPSSTFGAAADFSGTVYTLTWSSKDQIPTTDSSAVDFRFKVNDGDDNSAYGTATGFSVDNVDPTLTAGNLDIDDTSCTGTGGVCKIGNTIIFTWDNSGATGDGNSDEAAVTADLSGFGGSSSQTLYDDGATGGDVTASDDIYTFALTVPADNDDGTNSFTVTVTDTVGNSTGPVTSTDTAPVDNEAPTITDANITIAGGTGTGGAYIVGDTITVSWVNDLINTDIASATADLSPWGGSSVATMTDTTACGGKAGNSIFEACFTLVAGSIDSTGVTTSVTATDDAGNTTGPVSDTTGATVDNQVPTAPGSLSDGGKTASTITLTFGAQAVVSDFDIYKIFFKAGTSGVTTSDAEHVDSDLNFINYNGTSNTTVTGLAASTAYVFNIWVFDDAGNSANATEVSISTLVGNSAPTGSWNSAVQKTDGTGRVDISIEVNDTNGNDTKAKIEYETDEDGECNGPSWAAATLLDPVTADFSDTGGVPDINNANTYQVGSTATTRIITSSGSNTVQFDWDSSSDLPSANGTQCLRLTINDGTVDSISAIDTPFVDNVVPTLTSVSIASDNADTTLAKAGDIVTLSLTTSEIISSPSVSFKSGGVSVNGIVSYGNPGAGNDWTASYVVDTADTDGTVTFTVDFSDSAGNIGVQVTSVTDATSVTVDTITPTVTEVPPPIGTTSDSTPDFRFNTTEAGTIGYGGDCSSVTTSASIGANTVTFNTLADGTHNNCTLTITDIAGNTSDGLAISPFTIDTTEEVSPPPPSGGGVVFFPEVLLPPTPPSGGFRVIINPLQDLTKISTRVNREKVLLASLGEITGANVTNNREVELLIVAGSDAVRVAISNNSDFSGAVQELFVSIGGVANVFQSFISWKLSPWLFAFLALLSIILLTARLIPKGWIVIVILLLVGLLLWSTQAFGFIDIKIMRKQWTLTPEEGEKKVYVKVFTEHGVASETFFDTITYQKATPEEKPEEEVPPEEIKEMPPVEITDKKPLIAPSMQFTKNLQWGNYDFDVFDLQRFLNTNRFQLAEAGFGSLGNETSYFGPLTHNALIRFQEAYTEEILRPWGLTRGTGYLGSTTRAFINALIEEEE